MNWKDMWEDKAWQESEAMRQESEDKLLQYIATGIFGGYLNIWYAVADKQNPVKSVPILLEALRKIESERNPYYDELNAIHCATAICQLLNITQEAEKGLLIYGNRLQSVETFASIYHKKLSNL